MRRLFPAARLSILIFAVMVVGSIHGRADSGDADRQLERDTFALINQYRTSEGLPPFTWSAEVAQAARAHSKDMATGAVDFGHEGFDGRVNSLRNELPGLRGCGENVLMTTDLGEAARTAVALWLKSAPHRRNIRGDFTLSGLGVWESAEGVVYFTQIFVKAPRATDAEDESN